MHGNLYVSMVAMKTFILGQPPNFQNSFVMGQSKRPIAKNNFFFLNLEGTLNLISIWITLSNST
jgi:hypothetical protein